MRELEAEWAQSHVSVKGVQRPPTAYETATMLVDASQHAWKVLYINPQASRVTGDLPTALLWHTRTLRPLLWEQPSRAVSLDASHQASCVSSPYQA